jgi:hypothetical protein
MIRTAARKRTNFLFCRFSLISSFSNENVCCVMGYIVNLTVILENLFRSGEDVSARRVQSVTTELAGSDRKIRVHNDIRNFLTVGPPPSHLDKDIFMEKIVDLITLALALQQ